MNEDFEIITENLIKFINPLMNTFISSTCNLTKNYK